jgi:acetyl esterase/lipase
MGFFNKLLIVLLFSFVVTPVFAADFNLTPNVSYGADPLQKMDIYAPKNVKNAPVIFMVHGGAWMIGDKSNSHVIKNKTAYWTSRGYIFISVNYRMLPNADPLQQESDIVDALVYAQKNIARWSGNKNKFILMGHSAGAHLIALLSANPQPALSKGAVKWKASVFLDSAALDVKSIMQRPHYRFYDSAFGKKENFWIQASPFYQITKNASPMLMICSIRRPDSCAQAEKFSDKAITLGASAQINRQNLTHEQINEELGLPGEYTKAVDAFIAAQLSK